MKASPLVSCLRDLVRYVAGQQGELEVLEPLLSAANLGMMATAMDNLCSTWRYIMLIGQVPPPPPLLVPGAQSTHDALCSTEFHLDDISSYHA